VHTSILKFHFNFRHARGECQVQVRGEGIFGGSKNEISVGGLLVYTWYIEFPTGKR
jgi:hypothetical protein